MKTSNQIFSPEALSHMLGGAELTRQVVRVYSEELPGLLHKLSAAFQARDVRELGRLTHSLKGSLAMLAAHESAELAASASGQCLETGTIPDASLSELLGNLRQLELELQDFLTE